VRAEARNKFGCALERLGVSQIARLDPTFAVLLTTQRNRNDLPQQLEGQTRTVPEQLDDRFVKQARHEASRT
jgi:hypothetical protein